MIERHHLSTVSTASDRTAYSLRFYSPPITPLTAPLCSNSLIYFAASSGERGGTRIAGVTLNPWNCGRGAAEGDMLAYLHDSECGKLTLQSQTGIERSCWIRLSISDKSHRLSEVVLHEEPSVLWVDQIPDLWSSMSTRCSSHSALISNHTYCSENLLRKIGSAEEIHGDLTRDEASAIRVRLFEELSEQPGLVRSQFELWFVYLQGRSG